MEGHAGHDLPNRGQRLLSSGNTAWSQAGIKPGPPGKNLEDTMTDEDIEKLIPILLTADGGCPTCVQGLLEKLGRNFPETRAACNKAWNEENPKADALEFDDISWL